MTGASFPIALRLDGRRVLVVGSGAEARHRALSLAAAGADVHVVSAEPDAALAELAEAGTIALSVRAVRPADLDDAWLLVQAARDPALAGRLAREAERRRLFFCAVDDPRVGSFSHLAIARAGALFAAVGSQGKAPALARRLRELLEAAFARAGLETFVERLSELRGRTPRERRQEVLGAAVSGLRLSGGFELPGAEADAPHSKVGDPAGTESADGDG